MRWKGSQEKNHSTEPSKHQEKANRSHPTRRRVHQQFGQREGKVGDGEQRGPGIRVATSLDQSVEGRQQRQHGKNADRPWVADEDPRQQAQGDGGPEPDGQPLRVARRAHELPWSRLASVATRAPSARASSRSVSVSSPRPLAPAVWLAPYGVAPPCLAGNACSGY